VRSRQYKGLTKRLKVTILRTIKERRFIVSMEQAEMVREPEGIPNPNSTEPLEASSLSFKDAVLMPARQAFQMVRSRAHGYVETAQQYRTAAKKALALVAITATAGGGVGCGLAGGGGGGSRPIGGEYLYVSPDGATVESLDLVRNGSQLSGSAEILEAVTSDQAEYDSGVLDATGQPVPGTPVNAPVIDPKTDEYTAPSNNAACGGTPMCFEEHAGTINGRLGANDRISLSVVWTDIVPSNPATSVGELQGDGFVVGGAEFMPSDSKDIAAARSKAPALLRTVTMPAYAVHQEISALQKPVAYALTDASWDDVLSQDVSALQSDANIDPMNQLGCDYSEIVTNDIQRMQDDVTAENAEITKAQNLLSSLTPAVKRQAGGDVATVRREITARSDDLGQEVKQADAAIGKANAEAPKIETFLQGVECGAIHIAAHALLEAGG
jgi:hypothetical protein